MLSRPCDHISGSGYCLLLLWGLLCIQGKRCRKDRGLAEQREGFLDLGIKLNLIKVTRSPSFRRLDLPLTPCLAPQVHARLYDQTCPNLGVLKEQ